MISFGCCICIALCAIAITTDAWVVPYHKPKGRAEEMRIRQIMAAMQNQALSQAVSRRGLLNDGVQLQSQNRFRSLTDESREPIGLLVVKDESNQGGPEPAFYNEDQLMNVA